jgi:arabinose operon protein AraL
VNPLIEPLDGFVFDLDGTLYTGERLLPGSAELLGELRRRGKRILFASNKPVEPPEAYAEKLTRLGILAHPQEMLTSGRVLARYLASNHPTLNYYVIGEPYLKNELRQHGLSVQEEYGEQDPQERIDPAGVDAVIVAFDRTLDYRKLNTAYQALLAGARFFATNPDKACPVPGGSVPDAGATLAYLEHLTGRRLELLAGKPSPLMLSAALSLLDLPPERCLMTGDRLETDIRMGRTAGFCTCLVLTGATTRAQALASPDQSDLVVDNLRELL